MRGTLHCVGGKVKLSQHVEDSQSWGYPCRILTLMYVQHLWENEKYERRYSDCNAIFAPHFDFCFWCNTKKKNWFQKIVNSVWATPSIFWRNHRRYQMLFLGPNTWWRLSKILWSKLSIFNRILPWFMGKCGVTRVLPTYTIYIYLDQ